MLGGDRFVGDPSRVQLQSAGLQLSPSDVTAFLACEHLTTLSLAQARGEIERPEVENEQAELIFRKGVEHEHAYLRVFAPGAHRPRDPRPRETTAPPPSIHRAIRAGEADVIYQGVLAHEGWRGVVDFLMKQPDGTYAGTRHQACTLREARLHRPAPLLQRARAHSTARA